MEINFIISLLIILLFSSTFHGSIGFGFGMIATPLVALFTDMQTTIVFMVIPTIFATFLSVLSEGNFFEAFKKYWLIATLMVIGSAFGTLLLVFFNSEIFKLLLAFIIFLYLVQPMIKMDLSFIPKHPKISMYVMGLGGGMVSGLTNIVAPLMIMYTMELKYSKKDIIQLSNLCFMFTKMGQLSVLMYHGAFNASSFKISILSAVVVSVGMYFGAKLKSKIDTKIYTKILRYLLFIIALILVFTNI